MPSYADVRRWQPEPLDDAERQLKARSDTLVGLADELSAAARPQGWHGVAADAADVNANTITDAMERLVAGVNAARTALIAAADGITGLRYLISEAESLARARGFAIDDSGAVIDGGLPPGTPADQAEAVQQERRTVMAELVDRIGQIMNRAHEIDDTLANLLGRVERGEISDGGADTLHAAAQAGAEQGVTQPPIPGPPPRPPSDPGAGEHGSDPWWTTADDRALKELADQAATAADSIGWTHAAQHLWHYLDNSGDPLTVDPDQIGRDVAPFQHTVDQTVTEQMRRIADEAAANGTYGTPVQFSTDWRGYYVGPEHSKDWYYAMGGMQYAVTGVATVHPPDQPGAQPRVEIDYQTHVHDYYNWDHGKETQIGPFTISDDTMADMHRAGVAHEYPITGTSDTRHYDGAIPPPGQQPDLPQPPDNRDGTRTDPTR
jgi:uncharacterized protein YukE